MSHTVIESGIFSVRVGTMKSGKIRVLSDSHFPVAVNGKIDRTIYIDSVSFSVNRKSPRKLNAVRLSLHDPATGKEVPYDRFARDNGLDVNDLRDLISLAREVALKSGYGVYMTSEELSALNRFLMENGSHPLIRNCVVNSCSVPLFEDEAQKIGNVVVALEEFKDNTWLSTPGDSEWCHHYIRRIETVAIPRNTDVVVDCSGDFAEGKANNISYPDMGCDFSRVNVNSDKRALCVFSFVADDNLKAVHDYGKAAVYYAPLFPEHSEERFKCRIFGRDSSWEEIMTFLKSTKHVQFDDEPSIRAIEYCKKIMDLNSNTDSNIKTLPTLKEAWVVLRDFNKKKEKGILSKNVEEAYNRIMNEENVSKNQIEPEQA